MLITLFIALLITLFVALSLACAAMALVAVELIKQHT